jgi:hypothetical protein
MKLPINEITIGDPFDSWWINFASSGRNSADRPTYFEKS